ncbi:hypothetical protein LPJ66_007133 [Kickxella alabastrina]|uniref:Uncharacterized protein n=1 Tax=Kickxella alabastrina TaxID=61397 RepID=A0ACC1IAG9_9FUNG|nr:hypothetical protein LPJ66_007133 [Kickxella alabastrina]
MKDPAHISTPVCSPSFPGDISFPQAHTLYAHVGSLGYMMNYTGIEAGCSIHNVFNFLRAIRQMVPVAQEISPITSSCVRYIVDEELRRLVNLVVSKLFGGSRQIGFVENGSASFSNFINYKGFSDITHISFGSASLRKLKVSDLNKANAELLLYDSQREPMVYPHLESIVYRGMYTDIRGTPAAAEPVRCSAGPIVHFPKLKLLDFDSGYPFGDDVIFRGNSDTLEKLSIGIDSEFMDITTRYRIFADTAKFARLQFIGEKFDTITHARTLTSLSDVDAFLPQIMAAASISSSIVRFEFRDKLPGSTFMSAARTYSMFSTIQLIHIADCTLNFADIVTVLQRAPRLRSLNCKLSNDAPAIDGKSDAGLANYIYASNGVFGKYFQNLGVHVDAGFRKENVGEIVALLAIACPRFTRCRVGRIYRDELNSEVNKVLETDPYYRYAGLIPWFVSG